ncbi:shikimate dehydrogenase [Gordonia pseudamarae]|jgi:shikimate dehydrogenase|uniref:Shikimate dehydrogenase n=1 Tax=Gordonia pseudamarae TaxID=2831662 RepID=A0ABX6IHW7_9ACTN|nr:MULTISPECIES: shikimate dehydrogenase [Gordonia]MBD0023732.1 shikimate dehydrogenase [Gordonia sp. (in: high G+C Gram-positive bacteria)]QHN26571.1 shikimate dehydrogenase [Gordonia pseudamarae]QHN35464.1 shikimate dehydrogenase [Gordonia pseudamarae]
MTPRKAAVLGFPVSHSRSPDLHLAAYRALGLTDWTYERIECTAEQLPAIVGGAAPEFVGFSVTMPGKIAALEFADEVTDRARLIGSANTLLRTDAGWRADCTDVDGMSGALGELGVRGGTGGESVVIGGGGTALPTVSALADAGFASIRLVVRSPERAADVAALAGVLGLRCDFLPFASSPELTEACRTARVVVTTVPSPAAEPLIDSVRVARAVVDVIYDPWPTPLAAAVTESGGRVVGGLVMLLNQAYSQVEQFTGLPAPREAMAAAIAAG